MDFINIKGPFIIDKLIKKGKYDIQKQEDEYIIIAKMELIIIQQYKEIEKEYINIMKLFPEKINSIVENNKSQINIKNDIMNSISDFMKKDKNTTQFNLEIINSFNIIKDINQLGTYKLIINTIINNVNLISELNLESLNTINLYIEEDNFRKRKEKLITILKIGFGLIPYTSLINIVDLFKNQRLKQLTKSKEIKNEFDEEINFLLQLIIYFEYFILINKNISTLFNNNEIIKYNKINEEIIEIIILKINERFKLESI